MSHVPSVIDIERLVLRDPAFTAERGERIRVFLGIELQRALSPLGGDSERPFDQTDVTGVEVDPSDPDELIAHRLAGAILKNSGLAQEADGV